MSSIIPIDLQLISFSSAVAVAIIVYFGAVIGSIQISKYEQMNYYIEGLKFCMIYLVIPLGVSYTIVNFVPIGNDLLYTSILVIDFFILTVYVMIKKSYQYDVNIEKSFVVNNNDSESRVRAVKLSKKFFTGIIELVDSIWFLLLSSFINYICIYSIIQNLNIMQITGSIVVVFFNFTYIALSQAYSKLTNPKIKITFDDGSEKEGKLIKIDDYIQIISDNKSILISKEKIKYLEEISQRT